MPDTNEKVAALDALAAHTHEAASIWHEAWRTWLRDAALRGIESDNAGGSGVRGSGDEAENSLPAPLPPLDQEWVVVPRDLLEELDDYLLDREDVRDGSDGRPLPNDAMSLRTRLECYLLQPPAAPERE